MSEIGTFTVQAKWGLEEVPYEKEFVLWGEVFVVHRMIGGPGTIRTDAYKASHKETGFGIPNVDQRTVAAAEDQARAVLQKYGRKRVLEVIQKAREGQ
jgi:hypothetical protein